MIIRKLGTESVRPHSSRVETLGCELMLLPTQLPPPCARLNLGYRGMEQSGPWPQGGSRREATQDQISHRSSRCVGVELVNTKMFTVLLTQTPILLMLFMVTLWAPCWFRRALGTLAPAQACQGHHWHSCNLRAPQQCCSLSGLSPPVWTGSHWP